MPNQPAKSFRLTYACIIYVGYLGTRIRYFVNSFLLGFALEWSHHTRAKNHEIHCYFFAKTNGNVLYFAKRHSFQSIARHSFHRWSQVLLDELYKMH